MNINLRSILRAGLLIGLLATLTVASTQLEPETAGTCGGASVNLPFTDVAGGSTFFCSIAAAYFSGLTNGTTATTYGPGTNVTRDQMAAFVTRTMDQSLKRGSQRAALRQFWTTQTANDLALTTVGAYPRAVESDGTDLWVAHQGSGTVSRVRASDGKLLGTWTGASNATGVLVARGKIFVIGAEDPGELYQIDPTQPAGAVTLIAYIGLYPTGIAYDGQHIWTANIGYPPSDHTTGSVSRVTLNPSSAPTVTNFSTGFAQPFGIIYDGANIWVTDQANGVLAKLDSSGNVVVSYPVGGPQSPAFDGTNIWVPNGSNTVSVVRATGGLSGTVLATLSGNGLSGPTQAAFDGERILVTNQAGNSVSLWKASDLTPIGTFPTGANTAPFGVCSDGLNFWITFYNSAGKLARF
jgi:hypothetical protein